MSIFGALSLLMHLRAGLISSYDSNEWVFSLQVGGVITWQQKLVSSLCYRRLSWLWIFYFFKSQLLEELLKHYTDLHL